MTQEYTTPRPVMYQAGLGNGWEPGELEAVNGNLAYIRNPETGEADWHAPFEWSETSVQRYPGWWER